ncbi:hypothetical protein GOBAR_AA36813 [Gossypium barbadense]|uniref:Uncharacterized protein n=1 Tax=Gossypium barbadense TaxID=3634 RepID=A0A2P5VYK0_GOSBA|nr:hypothetical protein GOBAR_AA36813 [Gossypium barbadense]
MRKGEGIALKVSNVIRASVNHESELDDRAVCKGLFKSVESKIRPGGHVKNVLSCLEEVTSWVLGARVVRIERPWPLDYLAGS